MRILFLLLLLSYSCFGQTIQERVKTFEDAKAFTVKYDKFQKSTDITYEFTATASEKRPLMRNTLDMAVFLSIPDNGNPSVGLYFGRYGTLYNNETLRMLLDGELVKLTDDTIDYSVVIDIPLKEFEKIAQSKIVEFQINLFEGKLDAKQMTAFKNLRSLTKLPHPR